MADPQPISIALPDGRQYTAPSMEVVVGWARDGRIPANAVVSEPGRPPVVASLHPALSGLAAGSGGGNDAVATIIPYKNSPALIGYYVSVASLIPGVGLVAGPAAIALGVAGFKKARREPQSHGTAHAIVAIVLGSLTSLFNWGGVVLMIVAIVNHK